MRSQTVLDYFRVHLSVEVVLADQEIDDDNLVIRSTHFFEEDGPGMTLAVLFDDEDFATWLNKLFEQFSELENEEQFMMEFREWLNELERNHGVEIRKPVSLVMPPVEEL